MTAQYCGRELLDSDPDCKCKFKVGDKVEYKIGENWVAAHLMGYIRSHISNETLCVIKNAQTETITDRYPRGVRKLDTGEGVPREEGLSENEVDYFTNDPLDQFKIGDIVKTFWNHKRFGEVVGFRTNCYLKNPVYRVLPEGVSRGCTEHTIAHDEQYLVVVKRDEDGRIVGEWHKTLAIVNTVPAKLLHYESSGPCTRCKAIPSIYGSIYCLSCWEEEHKEGLMGCHTDCNDVDCPFCSRLFKEKRASESKPDAAFTVGDKVWWKVDSIHQWKQGRVTRVDLSLTFPYYVEECDKNWDATGGSWHLAEFEIRPESFMKVTKIETESEVKPEYRDEWVSASGVIKDTVLKIPDTFNWDAMKMYPPPKMMSPMYYGDGVLPEYKDLPAKPAESEDLDRTPCPVEPRYRIFDVGDVVKSKKGDQWLEGTIQNVWAKTATVKLHSNKRVSISRNGSLYRFIHPSNVDIKYGDLCMVKDNSIKEKPMSVSGFMAEKEEGTEALANHLGIKYKDSTKEDTGTIVNYRKSGDHIFYAVRYESGMFEMVRGDKITGMCPDMDGTYVNDVTLYNTDDRIQLLVDGMKTWGTITKVVYKHCKPITHYVQLDTGKKVKVTWNQILKVGSQPVVENPVNVNPDIEENDMSLDSKQDKRLKAASRYSRFNFWTTMGGFIIGAGAAPYIQKVFTVVGEVLVSVGTPTP
jgi:hypothetical protein